MRILEESGRLIADVTNAQDLPRTAAGFASFGVDTIVPDAKPAATEVALSKRPLLPSANPLEGAVAPYDELARFLGEALTSTGAAASLRWAAAKVEWIVAFL